MTANNSFKRSPQRPQLKGCAQFQGSGDVVRYGGLRVDPSQQRQLRLSFGQRRRNAIDARQKSAAAELFDGPLHRVDDTGQILSAMSGGEETVPSFPDVD